MQKYGLSGRGKCFSWGTLVLACAVAPAYGANCDATDMASLNACIGAAVAGDTVTLAAPITLTGAITLNNAPPGITLIANGSNLNGANRTIGLANGKILAAADTTLANVRLDSTAIGHVSAATGQTLTLSAGMLRFLGGTETVFGSTTDTGTVVATPSSPGLTANTAKIQIAGGTLKVGSTNFATALSVLGSTTVNAGATLDLNSFPTTINSLQGTGTVQTGSAGAVLTLKGTGFDGRITGGGSLTISGAVNLLGSNDYTGTTTVKSGSLLNIGNGGTGGTLGSGNIIIEQTGTPLPGRLLLNRSDDWTVANNISGAGALIKDGGGVLVLTGNNTYSGTTDISIGTLEVGDGATSGTLGTGNVTNNGTLSMNRSDDVTLNHVISGTGNFVKRGAGKVTLTGTSTYAGPTQVNAGTLAVNGSITSSVNVNSGGTLGGTGTVGATTVNSGGVLAPGNSIGTLTVNGNLTFNPGSVYRVEIDAAGNNDRVNVVGAPGTLTINGGTVDVQAGAGNYQRDSSYTILTSTGARTGTFDAATTNLAFLSPTLVYQPNAVLLNMRSNANQGYNSVANTPNQISTADYLSTLIGSPGSTGLLQQVDNLTADQARNAFDALSGSQHASASQVATAAGRGFSAAVLGRTGCAGIDSSQERKLSVEALPPDPGCPRNDQQPGTASLQRGLWVQALGKSGHIATDGNGPDTDYRSGGLVIGHDSQIGNEWLAGFAFGASRADWDADTRLVAPGGGRVDSSMASIYARYGSGQLQLSMEGSYANHQFDTLRHVAIGTNPSSAFSSRHRGREWAVVAQMDYALPAGDWELRPLASLRYSRLREGGFVEAGTGLGGLVVDARTTVSTLASAGIKLLHRFPAAGGGIELRAVLSHLYGDADTPVSSHLNGQPGSFTTWGSPLRRDALTLGAGISGRIASQVGGFADASYEYRGKGQNIFALTTGLRVAW